MNGDGRYKWKDGEYEGQFVDSLFQGKGMMLLTKKDEVCITSGTFIKGHINGKGFETSIANYREMDRETNIAHHLSRKIPKDVKNFYTYYDGEYKNGKYEGKGIIRFSNSREVRGNYFEGLPHGKVIIKEEDG